MKLFLLVLIMLVQLMSATLAKAQPKKPFVQAGVWTDTDGKFINAHGGGILQHN